MGCNSIVDGLVLPRRVSAVRRDDRNVRLHRRIALFAQRFDQRTRQRGEFPFLRVAALINDFGDSALSADGLRLLNWP
jgi:hypothetical protein